MTKMAGSETSRCPLTGHPNTAAVRMAARDGADRARVPRERELWQPALALPRYHRRRPL